MSTFSLCFDHGPLGENTVFQTPQILLQAHDPAQISSVFAQMESLRAQGYWLAGFASYELGYALLDKLHTRLPQQRHLPLLCFGAFKAPEKGQDFTEQPSAKLHPFQTVWSKPRYAEAFEAVKAYIRAGDTYQINLTHPLQTRYEGNPQTLYARLCAQQKVPYGAYVDFGDIALLSRSPELFFRVDSQGRIETHPMKGTAKRGKTLIKDQRLRNWLAQSEKNMAENVMIVDLLRNDLSRISVAGSVKTPELFKVETYQTLHQMISVVQGQLQPEITLLDIFTAMFPCGSITGAPKIRAMEIIQDLEKEPREAYCGSIGWVAPDGSMQFNVAIRTLTCYPDQRAVLNVGGGIVYDSECESEYQESLLKARFAQAICEAAL